MSRGFYLSPVLEMRQYIKRKKKIPSEVSAVIRDDWHSVSSYGQQIFQTTPLTNHSPTGTTRLSWFSLRGKTLSYFKGLRLYKCAHRPHRPSYSSFRIHLKVSLGYFLWACRVHLDLFHTDVGFRFIQNRSHLVLCILRGEHLVSFIWSFFIFTFLVENPKNKGPYCW